MQRLSYVGGSIWLVVAVLVMVCGGVFPECYGYEWQESRKSGGISLSFMSKNVTRGYRYREEGSILAVKYGSVQKSMLVRERRVDFCCEMEVDVDLKSVRDDEISWGCGFVCYAPVEGIITDIGGVIFHNVDSSSNNRVWSYGFCAGIMAENLIFRPSLYCIYKSYTGEVALEGRVEHRWDLLPFGLCDFALGFSGEVGWDYAEKPYGLPYASSLGRRDYWYYGMSLCLIYKLAIGEASVGVSYEGNAAEKYSWVNCGEDYENNVWFNALINFLF